MGVVVPAGPEPKPRRTRSTVVVLAGIGVLVTVGVITLLAAGQRSQQPAPATFNSVNLPAAPPPVAQILRSVTYELTGDGGASDVTYVGQGANIVQVADTDTPWSVSFDHRGDAGDVQFFTVSARNAGKGTLRCRILVDGTAVSQASTTGAGSVVRCAKTVS